MKCKTSALKDDALVRVVQWLSIGLSTGTPEAGAAAASASAAASSATAVRLCLPKLYQMAVKPPIDGTTTDRQSYVLKSGDLHHIVSYANLRVDWPGLRDLSEP